MDRAVAFRDLRADCYLLFRQMQGVTGFGSSIALLAVWVLSRAVGIRACKQHLLQSYANNLAHHT